jgi:signal transduction histidine kinase
LIARHVALPFIVRLLLFLCLAGCITRAFAVGFDGAAQPSGPAEVPTFEHVEVFEDVSARMQLDDVLALPSVGAADRGGFRAVEGRPPKPGFTRSAWWLRAVVRNRSAVDAPLVLALPDPRLEYVDFYIESGGHWTYDRLDSTPGAISRSPLHRYPQMRFTLAPGEQVSILIREAGDLGLMLEPKLFSLADYDALQERAALWGGGLIGGILALGWCALLIAYFSRSTSFLVLAGLCCTTALYEGAIRGYTKRFLWPHAVEWSARSIPVFGCLSAVLLLVFILRIAEGERTALPARRILLGFAVLEAISAAGSAFGSLYFFDQASIYISGAVGLGQVGIAAVLSRRGTPTARLMLVTVSFGVFDFALHVAETLGWLSAGPAWLNSDIHPNPIVAVTALAAHLVVLAAWINHVGKQRQEARQQLAEQQSSEQQRLRDEVARRTLALNDALLDAEEKNRQKIETLGYVSHDLRAPLATISSYVALLQGEADSKQAPLILAIERSVNYQLSLIDELVGYAKTELRPLDISPQATELPSLLNDIAEYSVPLCAQLNNLFFYQALTSLPRWLMIDGRRLQQVLLNLLSNASKFTRDGAVMMTVRAREAGGQWRLGFEVADTGIGIAIEPRSNVSSVLQQMQSMNGATGLGLFIAQRIVHTMGGELSASSAPGEGTSFSFEIVASAPEASAASRVSGASGALATDRVPYSSLGSGDAPGRRARLFRRAFSAPPAHDRRELASLAKDGRMTDIERWIDGMSDAEPAYAPFLAELRRRLAAFDFKGIEALALADAATASPPLAS